MIPDKTKIYIALPQDRDAVVTILARNGYTVRQGKEKKGKSKAYEKYVEFWRDNVGTAGANHLDQMDAATVNPAAVSGIEIPVPHSE